MYLTLGLGTALAINELIAKTTEIYPNPANNVLNIVSYTVGIENIYIYNTNGQLVLANEVNANQIRLNTSTLSKGVYIVDIKSKDTSIKRKLIIE
ncbi:MAG TPA: T9SS type A sorting domain-containing protein [Flavobacteriales bacterium]|nr:T9SS type A sorting domain-containing protein [Flavobacteriales bacterium]